ncbi:ATP-binding protein [archaeon]|nr:ATP-binding protein [archaeon]
MIKKEVLKEVIASQRKWILKLEKGIEREKIKNIHLTPNFAIIISGVRRCGKSTLLSQILKKQKKFYYLNLEDPKLDGFELKDFNKIDTLFKEVYGKNGIYFFDEIQNVNKWEIFVRYLVDKKEKVILTGSNASLLSKELGTRLTGRHIDIQLFPFSFKEFLDFTKEKASEKSYKTFLSKGGFPEFLKENNPEILNELLSDIIMRDIVNRYKIRNSSLLKKIAIYLISHVGKEFSFNSLKKMFQIKSVQTVIDYISYFEDSYVLFTVPKFSYSYKKQQINRKKVYSIDNGFSHSNTVSFSKDRGRMFENSIFLHLRKKYKNIFYFQEKHECDFIIKENNKINQAIQVCYNLNDENQKRETEGLLEAMKKFKLNNGTILTFSQEDEFEIKGKSIKVIPAYKFLMLK